MYPRFIQLFLDKQLEGVTRPQNFLPSVTLPSKVFTFMRKHSPKFSCRITPLTPPMLEVITALAAEEAHSTSPHSRAASFPRDAQGTPAQSAAQTSISQGTAEAQGTADLQGTAEVQGTADSQGTAEAQGTADIPQSPNDYTPTDESQTSRGDEGLLDLYALNREVRRLKKQTISQAKQIHKLNAKLKKLSKGVQPVVEHHALWIKSQNLKKQKKRSMKKTLFNNIIVLYIPLHVYDVICKTILDGFKRSSQYDPYWMMTKRGRRFTKKMCNLQILGGIA
ncbi:hypothetical protein Tco_0216681 [Tanacetum coccineum]